MVSLNVAKNQYAGSIVIPTEPKKGTAEDSTTIPISEPTLPKKIVRATPSKPDNKIDSNKDSNNSKNNASSGVDVGMVTPNEADGIVFPEISFNMPPTVESSSPFVTHSEESFSVPIGNGSNTTIPRRDQNSDNFISTGVNNSSNSTPSFIDGDSEFVNEPKEVNLSGQSIPTSNTGISVVVYGSNNTIHITNRVVTNQDKDDSDALPTLADFKRANTLEELDALESKFADVFKYMKAKRTVLEMDGDIQ